MSVWFPLQGKHERQNRTDWMHAKNSSKADRIAFYVLGAAHVATAPCVIHAVRGLAAAGYLVDVVTTHDRRLQAPSFDSSSVSVSTIPFLSGRRPFPGFMLLRFLLRVLQTSLGNSYRCVIGADQDGLFAAALLGMMNPAPLIYYSLEIRSTGGRTSFGQRIRKTVERWCHRRARLTIVQDDARARLLREENRIPNARVCIVPNTPAGSTPVRRSGYLRKKFGIPEGKRILLHAGTIADFGCVVELAHAARSWPEDWVLVIHGFGDPSYVRRVREASADRKAIVSLDVVPPEEVDGLVGSADLGIALYNTRHDSNIVQVGMSSGKFHQYVRCGLPVIATALPGLRDVIVSNSLGAVVRDADEIRPAAARIFQSWDQYSQNARAWYTTHGSFDRHFQAVLDFIASLHGDKRQSD